MKKRVLLCLLAIVIFAAFPANTFATSGRLKSASIVSCNGKTYGYHGSNNHWHQASRNSDGTYNAVGSPLSGNPCKNSSNSSGGSTKSQPSSGGSSSGSSSSNGSTTTPTPAPKSSDNTLSSLSVNYISVTIQDAMSYTTYSSTADISATANDSKATVTFDKSVPLNIGENSVTITVTAENSAKKTYKLTIVRQEAPVYETIDHDWDDYTYDDSSDEDDAEAAEIDEDEYDIPVVNVGETISTVAGISFIGAAGYGIYKIANKKPKK